MWVIGDRGELCRTQPGHCDGDEGRDGRGTGTELTSAAQEGWRDEGEWQNLIHTSVLTAPSSQGWREAQRTSGFALRVQPRPQSGNGNLQ